IPGQAQNYYGLLYSNGVYAHAPALSRQIIFMNGDPQDYFSYELQYSHGAIDTLTWHHAAVSYDSGRLRFYIDGALDKDTVISTVIYQFSTTADLTIGCSDGPDRFVGKLDDVRIYNRALSDQEIKSIYSLLN
ncbi:MAG TPA: LamG domain-containing protein, partial [Chitinivibrionales bacterium]|nr:LamG domain-containing protein [Chitinivibrionales bacterium]